MQVDVAVVGAGPAGLAAAGRAAAAGHRVALVERSPRVGGMAASIEVGGVRVDLGSHRLHPASDPAVVTELGRLLGDDLQRRRRNGRLRLDGRWVAFPLRPDDLVRRLPPALAARFVADTATTRWRRPRQDTFAEVVRSSLGPTALATFYAPYTRKLWGLDAEELHGDLARRRVSAASRGDLVGRLLRGGDGPGRTFLYPRRGFGQLVEALADHAAASGARLRLGSGATAVRRRDDAPAAPGGTGRHHALPRFDVGLDDGTTITASHVWSTAPLATLARLIDPPPPPDVLDAVGRVRHRGLALVYLVLDQPRYTPFDAHYLPAEHTPPSRVSEPKNYRSSDDDPPDRTVLCAEVPCSEGDAIWCAPDEELGRLVAEVLEHEDLPPCRPVEVVVHRLPRVYPVYGVGYEAGLARVEAWASSTGVVTFGRQGLFTPDNTHHAIAMGWAAADALDATGGFDGGAWARARDGFRSYVVED